MKYLIIFLAVFAFFSCRTAKSTYDIDKAKVLAHKFIIADGHVDLPYRLKIKHFELTKEYVGIPVESKEGDFDYKRAKKGGLSAPFMSIYIPSKYKPADAQFVADSLIEMVKFIANHKKEYFQVATTPNQVRNIFATGRISLPMGMENGSPIISVADVGKYRAKGISYITLTHAKDNQICDSSYDTTKTWHGLSPFGKDVIKEMAAKGVMVDVSHISDNAFYNVISETKVPVIASHSSCRAFTPGWERNMTDDMIKKMKDNGGVIMVNFGSTFLDGDVAKKRREVQKEIEKLLDSKGLKHDSEEAEKITVDYFNQHPETFSDIRTVANHIDHIVELAGIDHVGFGSDFDGVGNSLPTGLKDVADYPNLIAELIRRGYTDQDIEKVCSGNILRVWQKVLDYSAGN